MKQYQLVTVAVAAAYLSVAETTMRKWLSARRCRSFRVGRRRLVNLKDLDELIDSGCAPADPRVALTRKD